MTVQLVAPPNVNQFDGLSGTAYICDANGAIQAIPGDIIGALQAGFRFATNQIDEYAAGAPLALSTAAIVAVITLANAASLAIAAQPDVPRRLGLRYALSSGTATAGAVNFIGITNKGVTATEALSMVGANGTATVKTKNAFAHLISANVAGIAGNSTGTFSVGNDTALGLPLPNGAVGLSVFKEDVDGADEAVGTVDSTFGTVDPTTPPNGTHTFAFNYTYLQPAG